jgi:hypothetical protein
MTGSRVSSDTTVSPWTTIAVAGPSGGTGEPSTIHTPHMDRRNPVPDPHPLVSGFPCPSCSSARVRLATVADFFFYLRCDSCTFVWSHPERRQIMDRRRAAEQARDSRAS